MSDTTACRAGFYLHEDSLGATEVRAPPAGYFAPEFQTCLVRCVQGGSRAASKIAPDGSRTQRRAGYCPRSVFLNENACQFPSSVEKRARPMFDGNYTCPGSHKLHLCPAGKYCPDASEALECRRGRTCPKGSTSGKKCSQLFGGDEAAARVLPGR